MRGADSRIIIQERDRDLLQALATFRVIDREQAKAIGGFTSTPRANKRLLALTRAGLLRRFFLGVNKGSKKAVYSLSPKAALLVGAPGHGPRRPNDAILIADFFVIHQLAINEIYCALKRATTRADSISVRRWISFYEPVAHNLRLIPDAYCELAVLSTRIGAFVEVDLGHERLKVWSAKTKRYVEYALSGHFANTFGLDQFRVLVIVNSHKRLQSLRQVVRRSTQKIFWFTTTGAINAYGILGGIWLRPEGDELHLLFPAEASIS